jgi:hypothetical protein
MAHYPAEFITGAIAMGYLVIAGFFVSFWRRTGDGLFLAFAIAFGLLTIGSVARAAAGLEPDSVAVYLVRLVAFLLIIAAIVRKNIGRKSN